MKALITGGAGFIGSNLCRLLVENGDQVTILDNLQTGDRQNLEIPGNFRFLLGDIRDRAMVDRAIKGCDTVFHLAASVGNVRSIENPLLDAEINILGTVQVLEAARNASVRKIVVSSSSAIFGEPEHLSIAENHRTNPDSPYGVSKLCEEKLALVYAKLYDIEIVCLRYFNVYGINQRLDAYGNVIPIFVFNVLRGQPVAIFGDGEQTRDFVNVSDVARANLAAAMTPGVTGAFNIGSGVSRTVNCVADMLARCIDQKVEVVHRPPRAGEVRHSLADITAAGATFGYRPLVPFEEGLKEYIAWARTLR